MIVFRGCGLRAGKAVLLRDIDLTVPPGSVTAIVGPNGAGKSSLLRLASGELRPSHGEVLFAGRSLAAWSPRDLARRRAVVSQRHSLAMPMRAGEVVALGRQPWHGTQAMRDDAEAVAEAMALAGVRELAGRDHASLSGGEQQRVQIARALAQLASMRGERMLLLDEPTASLDMGHAAALLRLLRRLAAREGTGILLVLHDLNEARFVADHVAMLQAGRLVAAGAATEVLRPDLLRRVYGLPFHEAGPMLMPDYGDMDREEMPGIHLSG